jgi:hypothetical protein
MPRTPSTDPRGELPPPRRRAAATLAAASLLAGVLGPGVAAAQPVDPYGDEPPAPGAAAGADATIDEAVAASLVERAKELIAIEAWADAQQLLGEALVRSPDGAAAKEAAQLLYFVNARLTVPVSPGDAAVGGPGAGVDPAETIDPTDQVRDPEDPLTDRPGEARGAGRGLLSLHMAGWGAAVGVALFDPHDENDAVGAGILLGGLAGGVAGYVVGKRYDVSRASARTVGSLTSWGELSGALMGDVFGADVDGTDLEVEDPAWVVGGAVVGGGLGLLAGEVLRRRGGVTTDDVAVIDSLAAMGVVGGLTLGAFMQPAEGEGYSLNAALGALGGVGAGLYLTGRHEVSTRRMVRIDLWAGGGALVPWILYGLAADDTTNNDEQAFGFLSTAGLVVGGLIGRKVSRKLDASPARDGDAAAGDAPAAVVRRGSDGAWTLGAPALRPHNSRALGQPLGRGAAIDLVGVRF